MKPGLAIFTNDLGASFIDLHLNNLNIERTVAVGNYGVTPLAKMWPVKCPTLFLDQWAGRKMVRGAKLLGIDFAAMRERRIAKFLREHRVGVVLGEYLDQFLPYVPLMDRMRLPYVIQAHGYDVSAKLREPELKENIARYASARAILTRSEFHRQRLIALGLPERKIYVNFGGVHVPSSPVVRDASAGKRLLAIGLMVPKKGPIYLLQAFRLAAAKDPDLQLDFVGGGPLYHAVIQFVNACGLKSRVRLHGFAPENLKQQLIRECGVFVQHSITNPETGDEEGLPAAIQEAMAHGMAVVSTRHAGISEAVIEGKTGLLVDEGDSKAMAQAFLEVGAFAKQFGEAGYEEALKKHSWSHERDRLRHWLFESR